MTKSQVQFIPKNDKQIQFNCCYNLGCKYYLVEPSSLKNIKGFEVKSIGTASLKCAGCRKTITLKSNVAIDLEFQRLSKSSSTVNHPASLHAIDRFLMITRRKISTLERPISKSAYNPEAVEKRLIMLRTYRNYVFVGDDSKTPAMRLGLVNKLYDVSQNTHRN
ncbi:hypothetical protein WN093_17675 [Gammaproteobacteria bacterium AS21]